MIRKREIAFSVKDWQGREVILLKSTVKNHVARLHLDDVFAYSAVKENFAHPIVVVYNPGACSEQAIYDIPTGGHRYLQVNVKYKKPLGRNLIVSYYGIDDIPKGKELWKAKNG